MKLLRSILYLLGAGLAAGGVLFLLNLPPGDRSLADYVPAGVMFLFALLVFAVWAPMLGRVDHGKLLRTGQPATATVVDVRDTNSTINQQPVFKFILDVRRPDGSTYQATVRQVVARPAIGAIRPGAVVPVRVDPNRPDRVAIDSQSPARPANQPASDPAAAAAAWAAGAIPTAGVTTAADVLRDGVRGTATLRSASLTGRTLGEVNPGHADPATASDPLVLLVLDLTTADGRAVTAQGVYRVPREQVPRLAPGVSLPVAYRAADPANSTAVDWDRLARA